MTVVSISRKKICDAILKEPTTTLSAGAWVAGDDEDKVRSRDCSVCAVGAVMRNALLHPNQESGFIERAAEAAVRRGYYGRGDSALHEVRMTRYMSALSAFFETEFANREIYDLDGRARTQAVKTLKEDCVKFVKKNFPATIEIDIDGAKPAKDVKIVKE